MATGERTPVTSLTHSHVNNSLQIVPFLPPVPHPMPPHSFSQCLFYACDLLHCVLATGDGPRPQVTYNLEKVKDLQPIKRVLRKVGGHKCSLGGGGDL